MQRLKHQRREKMFGEGRLMPLDRNAKARIMTLAHALMRRTDKGKHYGIVSAKFLAVLNALLWGFHNAASGRCFPSYERIAERADCARSTVYEAINALERAGILTWVNRIARASVVLPSPVIRAAWPSVSVVMVDPPSREAVARRTARPGTRP